MTESSDRSQVPITFLGAFSRKLIINTLFNFLGRFWSFAATILLTPFIWNHLTPGEFGVWVILSAIFLESYTLLDLGFGAAFVKYISAFHAHEDYERINKVLFSGIVFYLLLGTLVIGIGFAVRGLVFSFLNISSAETAYLFALMACSVGNLGMMFLSVFRGVQRMDKSNAIEIGVSILNALGIVLVLSAGWGLSGLAANALVSAVILLVASWFSVKRAMPRISIGLHFDGALLREMFGYGAQILVSRLGSIVSFRLDKLIVARYLGMATVPFYEFSARLSSMARAVPLLMMSALIPATSELGARNDKEKIIQTYLMTSRYVALIAVGLVAFVALEAESLLRLWLGTGVERSVVLVQILIIGYGANVLAGPASQTGAGVGHPEFDMRSTILLTLLTPILGVALVREFGVAGVAAGTSIALCVAAVYLLAAFHRNYLGKSVGQLLRNVHLRPMAAAVLAILAVFVFHRAFPGLEALGQVRYLIPVELFLDFAVFATVYMTFLIAVRQVTSTDRRNFLGLMNFGFEFVRHPFREWIKIYR
jgi:O-antigen/teichoic acid export membrane protein